MTRRTRIVSIATLLALILVVGAPALAAAAPAWLDRVNFFRSQAGLTAVAEDPTLSAGDALHARYMVKNDYIGHSETVGNPYYTAAGALAASKSNVIVFSGPMADADTIDWWMAGPFHALGIIDPRLDEVGFGSYYEAAGSWHYGAALDVISGLGSAPGGQSWPVFWPGDGETLDVLSYQGNEHPDPLTGTGYSAPSGTPLIVQFGTGSANPVVTASSLECEGLPREHAVYTESTYSNPVPGDQSLGRAVMASRDAVFLIPREPLEPGRTYTASVTVGGTEHAWSFTTAGTPVGPVSDTIAGGSRYGTAVEASRRAFPSGAPAVIVATGLNWPDALGGAALAAAKGGPILLTAPTYVPGEVMSEIRRLGATEAVILGGPNAVSGNVENVLKAELGAGSVSRIGGADRYETAELIAAEAVALLQAGPGYDGTAFVATGLSFPDALAASPLAAANGWPIYLTPTTGLKARTAAAMAAAGVGEVVVLGGEVVVPRAIETGLESTYGVPNVSRLSGSDRYRTAVAIAEYGAGTAGLSWDRVAVATGVTFPDALAGGVMQGVDGSVLLLTPGTYLHAGPRACLEAHAADVTLVRYLGGSAALGVTVRQQVAAALD